MWVCTCTSDYMCQRPGVGSPGPAVTDVGHRCGCQELTQVPSTRLSYLSTPYYQNVLIILHKPILLTVTLMWAAIILWSANSVALRLAWGTLSKVPCYCTADYSLSSQHPSQPRLYEWCWPHSNPHIEVGGKELSSDFYKGVACVSTHEVRKLSAGLQRRLGI